MIRLTLLLFCISSALCAQEFKKLRFQIGIGEGSVDPNYNNPNRGGVLLFFVEPSYRISDKISAGIRLEAGGNLVARNYSIASYGVNGQYYFSNEIFRPFAGIGFSFYHPILGGDGFYGYTSRLEEATFGFYPRVGFDWRHLCFAFEMNVVSPSSAKISQPAILQLPVINGSLSSNYFSLKIGVSIGGGRKK